MTDNEIIKALERCITSSTLCFECTYRKFEGRNGVLMEDAFDLINRQKAKIKHLKSVMRTMSEDGA